MINSSVIRTKQFVMRHRGVISGVTGLTLGIVITHRYHLNNQLVRWGAAITRDQLQEMLSDPTKTLSYDLGAVGPLKFDLRTIDLSKVQ